MCPLLESTDVEEPLLPDDIELPEEEGMLLTVLEESSLFDVKLEETIKEARFDEPEGDD